MYMLSLNTQKVARLDISFFFYVTMITPGIENGITKVPITCRFVLQLKYIIRIYNIFYTTHIYYIIKKPISINNIIIIIHSFLVL